jgi:DNA (cytosine-5)-methyltransferase 1
MPFLIVYYGTDGSGGWQPIHSPLRTVTTLDRFGLVNPTDDGVMFRMLQVPELRRAMGFPDDFRLIRGNRREQIKVLGNAVCPPVMAGVLAQLCRNGE